MQCLKDIYKPLEFKPKLIHTEDELQEGSVLINEIILASEASPVKRRRPGSNSQWRVGLSRTVLPFQEVFTFSLIDVRIIFLSPELAFRPHAEVIVIFLLILVESFVSAVLPYRS